MKYTLTDETKQHNGITVRRIQYSDGSMGGWLEKEHNLSQDGLCKVLNEAVVYGNAWVYGNAVVSGNAQVSESARVSGSAVVSGTARVSGNEEVCSVAYVRGSAVVSLREHVKCVVGFKYPVTVTPQNVVVGCMLWSHKEALKVSYKTAAKDGISRKELAAMRACLLSLVKHLPRTTKVGRRLRRVVH